MLVAFCMQTALLYSLQFTVTNGVILCSSFACKFYPCVILTFSLPFSIHDIVCQTAVSCFEIGLHVTVSLIAILYDFFCHSHCQIRGCISIFRNVWWQHLFIDQELTSCHYSSCSSSCWVDLFKKAQDSIVSNWIVTKFGRNVLLVNAHRLTESDFRSDVTISRWQPWRHFMQKSAATWWMHTRGLPSTYTAVSASSWSIVHSYLF